jgi:hypothetical protein
MELLAAVAAFFLLAVAAGLWGVDSRPGFDGGRNDHHVRWFVHSKTD